MVTEAERELALADAMYLARNLYVTRGQHIPHVELEDLEQMARIALWKAEERYEARQATFRTYAWQTVLGTLQRYQRDVSRIPRRVWDGTRAYRVWEETPLDLEAFVAGTDDERIRIADQVLDAGSDFQVRVQWSVLVQGLPDRLARIIHLRYFCDRSQYEVADIVGVSQMQISRLERKALARLREMLTENDW